MCMRVRLAILLANTRGHSNYFKYIWCLSYNFIMIKQETETSVHSKKQRTVTLYSETDVEDPV